MVRLDLIAIHPFATELTVEGMQVQAMFARDDGERLLEIGPQFIRRAGLAGIIAR